jgi:hypothetical protein
MPPTTPERIAEALARIASTRDQAVRDLAEVRDGFGKSSAPWDRWLADPVNRRLVNRLVASLEVLRNPPAELAPLADAGGLGPGELLELLKRIHPGDLDAADRFLEAAPRFGEVDDLVDRYRALRGELAEVEARIQSAVAAAGANGKAGGGKREERDLAIVGLWNLDPWATHLSIVYALGDRYSPLSPEISRQAIYKARWAGKEVRDAPGF